MPRKSGVPARRKPNQRTAATGYNDVLSSVVELLESARRGSARAVNAIMTATYWEIGRRIVELEQSGSERADYGKMLLNRLAEDLTSRFGRGFGWRNLYQMRAFYQAYPPIAQTPSAISSRARATPILQTPSAISLPDSTVREFRSKFGNSTGNRLLRASAPESGQSPLATISSRFPLPWSHYVRLLAVANPDARRFYETEALRGGWSVRQLERQIDTQFYERTALSRKKAAMLRKGGRPGPDEILSPEEEIKESIHPRVPPPQGRIFRVRPRRPDRPAA